MKKPTTLPWTLYLSLSVAVFSAAAITHAAANPRTVIIDESFESPSWAHGTRLESASKNGWTGSGKMGASDVYVTNSEKNKGAQSLYLRDNTQRYIASASYDWGQAIDNGILEFSFKKGEKDAQPTAGFYVDFQNSQGNSLFKVGISKQFDLWINDGSAATATASFSDLETRFDPTKWNQLQIAFDAASQKLKVSLSSSGSLIDVVTLTPSQFDKISSMDVSKIVILAGYYKGYGDAAVWIDDIKLTTSSVLHQSWKEKLRENQKPVNIYMTYDLDGYMGLPAFAKENPEKAFAEVKVPQANGSVFRKPVEDWDGARLRIANNPEWKSWLEAQQRKIDAWMTGKADRADWLAGWLHDFVSPEDGSTLVWTNEVPLEETDHFMSSTGHRVQPTDKIVRGWIYGFRARNIENAVDAAYLYKITNDERYAEWAASQLDFYADNYLLFPLRNEGTARIGGQSIDDAVWLSSMVEIARLIFDYAGEERRQAWFDKLFKPQAELLSNSRNTIHNIAVWHRSSAAQVALLYNDEAIWDQSVDAPLGIRDQIRHGVTSDYFWFEQSMSYNGYVAHAIRPLLTTAALLGRANELQDEAAIIQNLTIAPSSIRFPDGSVPNPSDCARPISPTYNHHLGTLYRILPTLPGLAAAMEVRNWYTLIDPPLLPAGISAEVASTTLPEIASKHYDSSRFALLKDGRWQIFFHYGQNSISHAQTEALNWSASFDGLDITHDPGTVSYGSPMHLRYFKRGLNHNIPLVNGEGQPFWSPGEFLSFDPTPGRATVSARQPGRHSDEFSTSRTLSIVDDKLIDRSTVTLAESEKDAVLGMALHLQGAPNLPSEFTSISDSEFKNGRSWPFSFWKDVHKASFENEATINVTFPATTGAESKTLSVRISTDGRFTVYQASSPDVPYPGWRTAFYIEKETPGRSATFITELSEAL